MKMRVKVYGTLSRQFPGYRDSEGIEVEIPEGTTVKGLLDRLEISESQRAVVAMEGRILKEDDAMRCGAPVNILQAIHGG
jgi:sulfur carrier protein ThiS